LIITCVAHGRRDGDAHRLAAHLSKAKDQTWRIADASGVDANLPLAEILADLRRSLAYAPRATVGFQHLTINPARLWSEAQRDEAVRRILVELEAQDHAWVVVEHAGKARATAGGATTHWHLVVAHVGGDGRALNLSGSYARLEAVARLLEVDFGEPATRSRRTCAVATHLTRMGRSDVAGALSRDAGATTPRSAMSSPGRQRAARLGVDLPAARAAVRAAWKAPDLTAALASAGLRVGLGDRRRVPVVRRDADGAVVGALDRLAGVSRADATARLEIEMATRKRAAKPAGENDERNTNRNPRGQAVAGQTRRKNLARRGGDTDDGGGDSGSSDAGRGLPGPRFAGAHRGDAPNALDGPAAARRRRRRAVAELQIADAVARRRSQAGRSFETDVERAKTALWRSLFGAELSPELIGALCYVDVRERLVKLTNGGWVRDEGDRLLASGADPRVVAILVEAAKAKGWKSVCVWGDAAFVAEAQRQFAAAGIAVTVVEPPPPLQAERDEENDAVKHDPEAIVAELRHARAEAEKRLAWLSKPLEEPASLKEARSEARAADQALQAAVRRRSGAAEACDEAERELAEAGFLWLFGRGATRRRLAEAEQRYNQCTDEATALQRAHDSAASKAFRMQQTFDKQKARRQVECASEIQRAQADVALAIECETVATESRDLARRGIDAVEAVARARLQPQVAAPLNDADEPTSEETSAWTPR
jgi:hypothetical protein